MAAVTTTIDPVTESYGTIYEISGYFGKSNRQFSQHIGTPLKMVTIKVVVTSYINGGVPIDASKFGIDTVLFGVGNSMWHYYEQSENKLYYIYQDATTGIIDEYADLTDLSSDPAYILLIGY